MNNQPLIKAQEMVEAVEDIKIIAEASGRELTREFEMIGRLAQAQVNSEYPYLINLDRMITALKFLRGDCDVYSTAFVTERR